MTDLEEFVVENCGYVISDYNNCFHRDIEANGGYTTAGNRRFVCITCGQHFTDSPFQDEIFAQRVIIGKELLKPGETIRSVSERFGFARRIIRTVSKLIEPSLPNCPCGRKAKHNGMCDYRRRVHENLSKCQQ